MNVESFEFIFFLIENHHIKYTYNTIFLKILF